MYVHFIYNILQLTFNKNFKQNKHFMLLPFSSLSLSYLSTPRVASLQAQCLHMHTRLSGVEEVDHDTPLN